MTSNDPDFDRLMDALHEAGIAVVKTRATDRNEGISPEVALWEAVQHWMRETARAGRPRIRRVPARGRPRITPPQRREMERAAHSPLGVVEARWPRGFAHARWERMMARLTAAGLMRPYVHGGYEITAAGLASLQSQEP